MDVPVTVFAVAMALARNPAVVEAAMAAGHEICSHGYRWIDYRDVPEDMEREHLSKAIEIITQLTGERPLDGTQAVQASTPGVYSSRKVGLRRRRLQ